MFNRTILYLTRKKGKTFTLLALIVLISTFVTTSLALMDSTNQVLRFIRESVDGRIEIRQLIGQGENVGEDEDIEDVSELPLTVSDINRMMEISGITKYNASNRGLATSSDLNFRQGIISSESDHMGSIRGVNDSSLLSNFSDHRLSLTLGRHITPEDKNVVMISETLAAENNLTIDDTVALRPAKIALNEEGQVENAMDDNAPSVEAKIIGIFAEEEVQTNAAWQSASGMVANQLFSDHGLMTSLGLAKPDQYEEVTFLVQDPSELPRIVYEINQIEDLDLDWKTFLMLHDDSDYMRISGDLQTVQNLIWVLLIVIGIVSAIVLTLILILRMRGRMHEVGILLSVGMNKKQILGGFLLEIIIIAMPSFIMSYVSSILMVPALNQDLLADLPVLADLDQQQFQTMSPAMYALVYLLILLVVLSTAYVSTLLTIRLKPKQILSKMS